MKEGFSLLECLIYLSLIMASSLLISAVCINFFESSSKVSRSAHIYTSLWVLRCQMARDIHLAPALKNFWQREGPEAISWIREGIPFCWKYEGGKIFRIAGKETSTVADGVESCIFTLYRESQKIRGVGCTVSKRGVKVRWQIPLYEEMFVCI